MKIVRVVPPAMAVALLLAVLAGTSSAQELLRTDTGASGVGFGRAAPAGDVDDDGVDDLIVGAPFDDTAGTDAGRARVLSGADGSTLFSFTGASAGDRFGWSCAGAGDVNADGHDDLIVGAPQTNVSGGRGYARLLSGADGAVLRTLSGAAAGDQFGASVAGAGDIDGDGKDDVLVGAPTSDGGGGNSGAVGLYSGDSGNCLNSVNGSAGNHLGAAIGCDLPDAVKADNDADVIVSATCDGTDRSGFVQVRSRADFSLRYTLTGQAGQRLGANVAPAGDINGDGHIDLLVATDPRDSAGAPTGPAVVKLHSGANGALLRSFSDGQTGSGYGAALAGLGDVTGDDVLDLAVGEPGHDGQGTDAGSLRIYSGQSGQSWYHVLGPAAGAGFGSAVAFAGDQNDDGLPDCAVGAPAGSSTAGHVYSLSVTRWEPATAGLPGLLGIPRLTGQGGLVAAVEATLSLTDARPGTAATLILGFKLAIDPAVGKLVPVPDLVVDGLVTSSSGTLDFGFTWPSGLASGTTVYHQFVVHDPDASGGQARSNSVAAKVP